MLLIMLNGGGCGSKLAGEGFKEKVRSGGWQQNGPGHDFLTYAAKGWVQVGLAVPRKGES